MPPVRLQLGLAGAAGADGGGGARLALQVGPHARESGQQIAVLGQLHLQLALPGMGPLGEDVQDEPRPVQDPDPQGLLQHPSLGGGEVIIEEGEVALLVLDELLQLLDLAAAQKTVGIRLVPALQEGAHGLGSGGLRQSPKLFHADIVAPLVLIHGGGVQAGQSGSFLFCSRVLNGSVPRFFLEFI